MVSEDIIKASEWLPIEQTTLFLKAAALYSGTGTVPEEPAEECAWYALFLAYKSAFDEDTHAFYETPEEHQRRVKSEQNRRYYLKHRRLNATDSVCQPTECPTESGTENLLNATEHLLKPTENLLKTCRKLIGNLQETYPII